MLSPISTDPTTQPFAPAVVKRLLSTPVCALPQDSPQVRSESHLLELTVEAEVWHG